ncbi:ABC transporter ATP-binding protein [Pseudactinotalea sp. Z1739]|uniref:ABC transporter ATP-binding protein n=1 Tax=Pseudactinotalea sp. Z1739 TaxID=3413028 RepID=UPI003C79F79C
MSPRRTTAEAGTAPTTAPLLEVRDLTVEFGETRRATAVVDGVSLHVQRGRTLGVVGESGSGKSMTSLALMGLLPVGAQASGSVVFDGEALLGRTDAQMRRLRGNRISMVFQDPLSSLNPYYSVGFQIAEAYRAHRNASRKQARAVAVEAMEQVRIPSPADRYDHYPHQFSGGMRQRIMIAMALVCEPDLLIADEPTTALDVTVQARILELLSGLQEQTGIAMIFITHDLAVVSQMADDILVMRHGKQVEAGPAERIFSAPQHAYTTQLLHATPRIDGQVH